MNTDVTRSIFEDTRLRFQAVTMTLASLGQLQTGAAATKALLLQAKELGLPDNSIDPHVGERDHAKLYVTILGEAGHFPVSHPSGELGTFVFNRKQAAA
jgi:hypothetical protein